ncbi:uncharacterized protein LOC123312958 [Coccinella septempunctata]|uniref:uncharacterized protein LOC123312958 n=1 Tax=Coccinella septempunctata TaxID=41139 RepID=UPI001D07714A|nr:uncharacterized protein LOC123312958 [Coccinella septempunctata]
MPGGRWECVVCRGDHKSGDTSSSPMTHHVSPASQRGPSPTSVRWDAAGDVAGGVVLPADSANVHMGAFQLITSIKSEVSAMRCDMRELRNSVTFCSDKISDFENKLAKLYEVLKLANQIKMENDLLKKEVFNLQVRLDIIEQNSRLNNIEIMDIPERKNENLNDVVNKIGECVGVVIEPKEISSITRVPTRIVNKPKNIVVKFVSKSLRDKFMSAVKAKRGDLGGRNGFKIDGLAENFFVNEHLTTRNKVVFRSAREFAKRKGYKFVWVQNGNILIRKNETSRILQIQNEADLSRLSQ